MFLFFSNRLGCLTSIVVSLAGTAIIILLMKGCQTTAAAPDETPPPAINAHP